MQLTLRPGARLGLLGANGAGKSTLIKVIAGELAPLAGRRVEGHGLAIGYFAQHQLELLRPDESPLRHLALEEPKTRELELRSYLGRFDFRGAMADTPIGTFSGGERSRLALALIVRRRPNLLLLDEPTNHLDLEMRHALTRALAEYEGSLVLVSHDRALLRTVCDGFLLVADGRAAEFDGDVDDYLAWLAERRTREGATAASVTDEVDRGARRARSARPPKSNGRRGSRSVGHWSRKPASSSARSPASRRRSGRWRPGSRTSRSTRRPMPAKCSPRRAAAPKWRACSRLPRIAGSPCRPSSRRSASPDSGLQDDLALRAPAAQRLERRREVIERVRLADRPATAGQPRTARHNSATFCRCTSRSRCAKLPQ